LAIKLFRGADMGAKGVDAAAMESVVYRTQLAIKLFRGADMGAKGVVYHT
jgi:hypothetical protein